MWGDWLCPVVTVTAWTLISHCVVQQHHLSQLREERSEERKESVAKYGTEAVYLQDNGQQSPSKSSTNLELFIFLPPSVNIRIGVLLLFLQPELWENKIYFWFLSFSCLTDLEEDMLHFSSSACRVSSSYSNFSLSPWTWNTSEYRGQFWGEKGEEPQRSLHFPIIPTLCGQPIIQSPLYLSCSAHNYAGDKVDYVGITRTGTDGQTELNKHAEMDLTWSSVEIIASWHTVYW